MKIKRKRLSKTSTEQYEEYLKFMEKDLMFREGNLNSSVNLEYVHDKWEELADKMNKSEHGPALTAMEWKKRFNDWKNGTRAKYRKMLEDRKNSNEDCASKIFMNSLEKRGLAVWGKVASTGSNRLTSEFIESVFPLNEEVKLEVSNSPSPEGDPQTISIGETEIITADFIDVEERKQTKRPDPLFSKGYVKQKERSLKCMTEELLTFCKRNSCDDVEARRLQLEDRKLDIEERRLQLEENKIKFEIAKFKFANPTFQFDM